MSHAPTDDRFVILNADRNSDRARWIALWNSWPHREVFAHPAYVGLFAALGDRVCCAAWEDQSASVLYPFILRPVDVAGSLPRSLLGATDITSPYGYGGPYCWGTRDPGLAAAFWSRFDTWALSERVVSEFIRFDLRADRLLPFPGPVVDHQQNVIRTLPARFDDIWMDMEHKVRKNVKRAALLGVQVRSEPSGSCLPSFLEIYHGTMLRRQASARYMFTPAFFDQLHASLAGQFIYFLAHHHDTVVAVELVLLSSDTVYSFLGGTSSDAFDLRANDFLKHQIMLWAHAHGKSAFVLGGGFEGEDGIFRYKRSFAPRGCIPFRLGRRILDPVAYDHLVQARTANEQGSTWVPLPGFFPEYRG